jgi:hypothetical protein
VISDITRGGLVTLTTDEPVALLNEGKSIDPELLSLTYIKQSNENVTLESWRLISYTQDYIQIQLSFDEPLLVSAGEIPDQIKISLSRALLIP